MTGKIIKGVGGFYEVDCNKKIYVCKAKGAFRNIGIKPLIGDNVIINITDESKSEGTIEEILERKNSLIRPAVANIDKAILVLAVKKPDPQFYLVDKYLISMEMQSISVDLVFNKCDLDEVAAERYADIYRRSGYTAFTASAVTREGIDKLKEEIKGKLCTMAGPSGVGKSSITNILCPDAAMETGSISKKIDRGKHTTRYSEIFPAGDNSYICDTPGFTSIDISALQEDELRFFMPDIAGYEGKCRYTGCKHLAEPDCEVKKAVAEGRIDRSRYESYVKIYSELEKIRRY